MIQLDQKTEAQDIYDSLDEKTLEDDEIKKIKKLLTSMNMCEESEPINELKKNLQDDPLNKELRLKLAKSYLSTNNTQNGFEELLYLFDQEPKWNDEIAKKILLEHFDLLGFNDPNVIQARKKLSSLMFK